MGTKLSGADAYVRFVQLMEEILSRKAKDSMEFLSIKAFASETGVEIHIQVKNQSSFFQFNIPKILGLGPMTNVQNEYLALRDEVILEYTDPTNKLQANVAARVRRIYPVSILSYHYLCFWLATVDLPFQKSVYEYRILVEQRSNPVRHVLWQQVELSKNMDLSKHFIREVQERFKGYIEAHLNQMATERRTLVTIKFYRGQLVFLLKKQEVFYEMRPLIESITAEVSD